MLSTLYGIFRMLPFTEHGQVPDFRAVCDRGHRPAQTVSLQEPTLRDATLESSARTRPGPHQDRHSQKTTQVSRLLHVLLSEAAGQCLNCLGHLSSSTST